MFGKRTESTANNNTEADAAAEDEKPKIKYNNDIRDIRNVR